MPNAIKYSTTIPTGSLLKGTVALGVNGNLGPTANTGFYSMPAPASGKYIINKVAASGVPLFFAPQNDTELIQFARNEGATGANTGSAAAVLSWIATQPNLEAANFEYPNIVTSGLVLNVDAGFVGSYPTTGSTWYDISGNGNNVTLVNGPTFSSANSGSIVFDGIDDYAYIPATNNLSFNNSSFSYSLIFSIPDWTFTSERIVLEYGVSGYDGYYQITFYPNKTTFRTLGINGYSTWFDTTVNFLADQNYNVVLTYNLATSLVSLYINGVLVNSATRTGTSASTPQTLYIYSRGGTNWFQKGNLYNILAYNIALSSSQVSQNYNAQKGRYGL